jgi:hypothetical protein
MAKQWQGKDIAIGIGLIVLIFLAAGCSGTDLKKTFTSPIRVQKAKQSSSAVYYDFADVLVPTEMKIDKRASFIYKTPGFAGGVLSLKGRVEVNSLINFFNNNMVRDNWKLISSFSAPRTIMLFHKENRWCVVNINEGDFSTRAEIWVAPTINEVNTGDGLLK